MGHPVYPFRAVLRELRRDAGLTILAAAEATGPRARARRAGWTGGSVSTSWCPTPAEAVHGPGARPESVVRGGGSEVGGCRSVWTPVARGRGRNAGQGSGGTPS